MPIGTWEKAQGILQDGDILLFLAVQGISSAISWAQWIDGQEADRYAHAALAIDVANDQGYEQNPPSTHYTKLSQQPWDRMEIWRLLPGIKIDPAKLRAYCAAHLGIGYPFFKYFRFIEAAALARAGATSAALAVDSGGSNKADPAWEVCSATVCDALDHAKVDPSQVLWTKINDEDERPADIPLGKVMQIFPPTIPV